MNSEAGLLKADNRFELFGDKALFALEVRLLADPADAAIPAESVGSWGAWRLWVANLNLCSVQFETWTGLTDVAEVRWFLAPLFKWIAANWTPLLHETHLPPGGRWGDRRPRWSRSAYLAILESAGDDIERFDPWQRWATRHAIRAAADGGIVPDVFLQRIGDDIEFSWGDRVQPGADSAVFLVEDGVARASVDAVATTLSSAMDWFLNQDKIRKSTWAKAIIDQWSDIENIPIGMKALNWYLDSTPEPGPLAASLTRALEHLQRPVPIPEGGWWGKLAPEVAMFGDLSPQISDYAAVNLLAEYFNAQTTGTEGAELASYVVEEPAWVTTSPWDNGYALALDMLEEADPDAEASSTHIEEMLRKLKVTVRDVALGPDGPRGVALAGAALHATILVNNESPANESRGRRFTLAHELCHILFDRERARPLTHSSTPWASPSVEQRANAFAAMLLMPPHRAKRPMASSLPQLKHGIELLAGRLNVSRVALKHHLANLGEITPYERDFLLGNSWPLYG
jgi:Zn-dependent peptidase ImmA (M78 family)